MCNQFTLHHQFRIDTGRDKIWAKDRQYSFCLWILWTKNTEIRIILTWKYRVLHNTCQKKWKKHQDTVYWVDINLVQQKGSKFYQTRSNAISLYDTLPAYCIPKAIMMETGEITHEKVHAAPRPPPMISFKDNWMKELGSEVAGGSEDSQQTQPRSRNPITKHGETCEEWATIWFAY